MDQVDSLIRAKTVTINNLLELMPADTVDPTVGIYDTTMYATGGVLVAGLVCNALIRPVDARHHEK